MRPVADFSTCLASLFCVLSLVSAAPSARAQDPDDQPVWLNDRGPGIPTSLFGSYIEKGEFLFYPFYEFEYNSDAEYTPSDFNFVAKNTGPSDIKGETFLHELLLFGAYAPTDWLAFELEFAYYANGTLEKSGQDPSNPPSSFSEDGFGDLQFQFRWRWWDETWWRPYFFSYFEVVPALRSVHRDTLVGESGWELVYGGGLIKGFRWGTVTARISGASSEGPQDGHWSSEFGEYAVEYLKRLSPSWRVFAAVEGEDDEVSLIPEMQYFFRENIYLKFNVGVGLTPKAVDVAPEIGVMFSF